MSKRTLFTPQQRVAMAKASVLSRWAAWRIALFWRHPTVTGPHNSALELLDGQPFELPANWQANWHKMPAHYTSKANTSRWAAIVSMTPNSRHLAWRACCLTLDPVGYLERPAYNGHSIVEMVQASLKSALDCAWKSMAERWPHHLTQERMMQQAIARHLDTIAYVLRADGLAGLRAMIGQYNLRNDTTAVQADTPWLCREMWRELRLPSLQVASDYCDRHGALIRTIRPGSGRDPAPVLVWSPRAELDSHPIEGAPTPEHIHLLTSSR